MKITFKELLERYEKGERDFSRVDLNGIDLSGAVWDKNENPIGAQS